MSKNRLSAWAFHDTIAARGGWNRIVINRQRPDQDSIIFDYCRFEFSKADSSQKDGGALFIAQESKVRISNCTFYKNMSARHGGAIYMNSSGANISRSSFIQNHGGTSAVWGYGGSIYGMNSFASLENCHFMENTSTGIGGAMAFDSVCPSVINCIFITNYSPLGGAIGVLRAPNGGEMIGSLFIGNSSCFFGGSLAIIGSSPKIINNTIVNGTSMYAGGLYLYQGSHPTVANCIFWGNNAFAGYGRQVHILDSESQPKFHNCTFQHGAWDFQGAGFTGVYEDCVELDPLFVANGEHPFQLTENSPCINTGTPDVSGFNLAETDLGGNERINNSIIDMGAYEFQSIIGIDQRHKENQLGLVLNYLSQTQEISVTLNIPVSEKCTFELVDIQGRIIQRFYLGSGCSSGESIHIPCQYLQSGVYLGRLTFSGKQFSGKLLIIK